MRRPAWYLAPYIVGLGILDWLAERSRIPAAAVIADVREEVVRNGHYRLKQSGVGAALFGLLVLFVAHVSPPVVEHVGSHVPPGAVLPATALLGAAAAAAMIGLVGRASWHLLARAYRRGLRVWEKKQALYAK